MIIRKSTQITQINIDFYIETPIIVFTNLAIGKEFHNGPTTGTHNGHDYIDLGLPSGTLWATCNVGANNPEDYGDYFAWGETEPKSDYSWNTYKYGSQSDELTKYCTDSDYGKNGFTDNKTVLAPEDDAATVNWGGDWRMPTIAEQKELLYECHWKWTDNYNNTGISGCIVTGKNARSIFFPATGYNGGMTSDLALLNGYWSSSLSEDDPHHSACYIRFNSNYYEWYRYYRCDGHSVRAVCSSR